MITTCVSQIYLHAEMHPHKNFILKLEGEFVDIMCSVNSEHAKNIIYEQKGRKRIKVFYLKVLRAIYGCLESALLWYQLYSSTLQKWVSSWMITTCVSQIKS